MFATHFPGLAHPDKSFDTTMPTSTLEIITHDPRNLDNQKYVSQHPTLARLAEERERIQRPFKGQKKANVPKYRDYLAEVDATARAGRFFGAVPTITLWTDADLMVKDIPIPSGAVELKTQVLVVPHGVRFIAIDGETQLAARYEGSDKLKDMLARVTIHYGKPVEWAIGAFVDLNTKMVAMNKEMTVTKSPDDVLTRIARDLARNHNRLYERIKESDTTILQSEHHWMTLGKLRLFVGCVWRGRPGVAIGSRPVLENDFKEDNASPEYVREVCWKFWDAVNEQGPHVVEAFEDRRNTVIGTPAVIAALGAIAHECGGGKGLPYSQDTDILNKRLSEEVKNLNEVVWNRSELWSGLCGRVGTNGQFRVSGGAKDGVYDVFRVLRDRDAEGYSRVRQSRRVAANAVAS